MVFGVRRHMGGFIHHRSRLSSDVTPTQKRLRFAPTVQQREPLLVVELSLFRPSEGVRVLEM